MEIGNLSKNIYYYFIISIYIYSIISLISKDSKHSVKYQKWNTNVWYVTNVSLQNITYYNRSVVRTILKLHES